MSSRWDTPQDRPSPRDAALLSEVFDSLRTQLTTPVEGAEPPPPAIEALISAALAELHRVSPIVRPIGGVAPVLGSGVLQQLLRQRHEPDLGVATDLHPNLDERR